jgi:hypothetical protein
MDSKLGDDVTASVGYRHLCSVRPDVTDKASLVSGQETEVCLSDEERPFDVDFL